MRSYIYVIPSQQFQHSNKTYISCPLDNICLQLLSCVLSPLYWDDDNKNNR